MLNGHKLNKTPTETMPLDHIQVNDFKENNPNLNCFEDLENRRFFSQDVFSEGCLVDLIASPANQNELQKLVQYCYQQDIAMFPRGGGLSYTSGYLNEQMRSSVCIDFRSLNKVLEINVADRFVRVEAGVTWKKLHDALESIKMTTPFWGTLSGLEATVGASISQHSVFFGSANGGISAESVLGIKAVGAYGEVLNTGCYSTEQHQAIRFFGPDLCGLLTGDCGAFGVKSEICLKLIARKPLHQSFSFAFDTAADLFNAVGKIQALGFCSELFAFDPVLQKQRMKRTSLSDDITQFAAVLKNSESWSDMFKKGSKIAKAGRRFLDDVNYSLHCVIEASSEPELSNQSAQLRTELESLASEVENTIPVVIRSNPFTPPTAIVGPLGERWVPMHGVFRFSSLEQAYRQILELLEAKKTLLEKHNIVVGFLMAAAGTNGFLLEPVFYWPDELNLYHRRTLPKSHSKNLKSFEQNLSAREQVTELKVEIAKLMDSVGATHFQIGRFYNYKERLDPKSLELVLAIKNQLDPKNLINPGVLGLD